MSSHTDPITVIVLMSVGGHEITSGVADTLAAAVRTRIETLLTARRGPLPAEEIDRMEFTVATELMTLAIAMIGRLPQQQVRLEEVGEALTETIVELTRMRDERRVR